MIHKHRVASDVVPIAYSWHRCLDQPARDPDEIRRAIGDSAQDAKFIRTAHGLGYAFCSAAVDVPRPRATISRQRYA
jgi:hypothetical protein